MDELSFEAAWAIIELGDMIEYDSRDNFGDLDHAAYIPITKINRTVGSGSFFVTRLMDDAVWSYSKTWYYHTRHSSLVYHKSEAQAKKYLKRVFKEGYRRSPNFRKAVNDFLNNTKE